MADRALRVAGMLLHQLPHRQTFQGGFVRRQRRHVLRRTRQTLAEQNFGNPIAAQDRAGAQSAGLLGEGGRLAQDSTPGKPLHAVDPAPLVSADPRNPVMRGQGLVQKCMVRVENAENRTIVLKQIGKELDRLFVHRAAQTRRRWESADRSFHPGDRNREYAATGRQTPWPTAGFVDRAACVESAATRMSGSVRLPAVATRSSSASGSDDHKK